jgi:hypothetical protein
MRSIGTRFVVIRTLLEGGQVRSRLYLGGVLLLIIGWCGACTGPRDNVETRITQDLAPLNYNLERMQQVYGTQHYFDDTEVDLEHGYLEPASRYSRPQWVRPYRYDSTEVDLAKPRPEKSDAVQRPAARPTVAPAARDQYPIPGGDR